MVTWLALLQIGLATSDSTPIRPILQLVHTKWTTKDGAPVEVTALAQTADGYLWIGAWAGLFRFDGVRFVPFVPRQGDVQPGRGVSHLFAARDGSLWIIWGVTLSRLLNGRLTSFGPQNGFPGFRGVSESSTGTLVAATERGLLRFSDGTWKDAGREWEYPGQEATTVWFDHEDGLWAVTEDRIVYLPPGGKRFVSRMRLRDPKQVLVFSEEKDGTVWASEIARSAHTVPRNSDTTTVSEVAVGASSVVVDRKGSVWIASLGDGLRRLTAPAKFRGRVIAQFSPEAEHFTERNGLMSDVVAAMIEDREGNIWVGNGRGVERFQEAAFTPYPTAGSVRPRAVFATRDTTVWVATGNERNFVRFGARSRDTVETSFIPVMLVEDRNGNLWTPDGVGIRRWQGGRFAPIPLTRNAAKLLWSLAVDTAGTLWAFDESLGLFRLHHDSLIHATPHPDGSVFGHGTLFADRNGRVWVGLTQGTTLTLHDPGQPPAVFDRARGTGPGHVRGFLQDHRGTVWAFGVYGLSRFEGTGFRNQRDAQGIPDRAVFSIAEDDEGAWWMVTRRGLVRVPAGEFDRAFADTAYVVRFRSFDARDGVPGMVTNSVTGPMVARGADGLIWASTDSGVASVDPRRLSQFHVPPVLIEAVHIDGRELLPAEAATIPPRPHDLEIDYTAATLAFPDRVQFRYRLEGADESWREVGARRRAYYTGLGPGSYRFRVSASNGDGVWNDSAAVWSFQVMPAWYQTLGFRAAVVLLIAGVGGLGAAAIQRRRHHRAQAALKNRYEATLAERARIAQDLHDTLLQGFAGVTLHLKAIELALPEQPDVATATALRAQLLARESLREARERVWDMREREPDRDDLPTLLEAVARERCAGAAIEVSVVTTGQRRRLTRPLEDAAFRAGREAVVNAVRHSGCHRIEINITFGAKLLRLEVSDDGRGFSPDEVEQAGQNGHFGLSGMRERAAHLGGLCEIHARHGGGTVLILELPIQEAHTIVQ
jgi:signal transduction histidine kinase/ligand-binding sensor domain-containing protein